MMKVVPESFVGEVDRFQEYQNLAPLLERRETYGKLSKCHVTEYMRETRHPLMLRRCIS